MFFFILIVALYLTVSDFVQIEAAYFRNEKTLLIWGLMKVCISNLIIAHIIATIILAMSYINLEQNWMTRASIDDQVWWVKYFYAYYWGTTIMMTVGFGDILPGN